VVALKRLGFSKVDKHHCSRRFNQNRGFYNISRKEYAIGHQPENIKPFLKMVQK